MKHKIKINEKHLSLSSFAADEGRIVQQIARDAFGDNAKCVRKARSYHVGKGRSVPALSISCQIENGQRLVVLESSRITEPLRRAKRYVSENLACA